MLLVSLREWLAVSSSNAYRFMLRTEFPPVYRQEFVLITIFRTPVNEFRSTIMFRTPQETGPQRLAWLDRGQSEARDQADR